MEYLSIGKFAKLGSVSESLLRVYHKKGLLVPEKIDAFSGYRSYSVDQLPVLDTLMELQTIGFSLEEMKDLLKSKDVHRLASCLHSKKEDLEMKKKEIEIALSSVQALEESCSIVLSPPMINEVMLEEVPKKCVTYIDMKSIVGEDTEPQTPLEWETVTHALKEHLGRLGYPKRVYPSLGGIIPKERLIAGRFSYSKIFVPLDETLHLPDVEPFFLPEGQYLTMYTNHCIDPISGESNDSKILSRILDYLEHKSFRVNGDCYYEQCASGELFGYQGRDCFFKLFVPVTR